MNAAAIIEDALGRVAEDLPRLLNGLSPDQLRQQPKPDCNPIGWTVWHLARVHDAQVSNLAGEDQAWTALGWAERFGREPNKRDTGFGDTPEQVAAFDPVDVQTLIGYHDAVWERTRAYLATLSDADLDRVLNEPRWNPMPTVGVRLVSTINDCTLHLGEAAYIRGLLEGKGWQPF